MPSWAEGTLSVKGKARNVISFLTNAIEGCFVTRNPENNLFKVAISKTGYCYLEKSNRAFIHCLAGDSYLRFDSEEDVISADLFFAQAWRAEAEDLARLAIKYHVAFKLHVEGPGFCFTQDIDVNEDGNILRNAYNEYEPDEEE